MALNFKFNDGFYFAHSRHGMFSVEQHRGEFVTEFKPEGPRAPYISVGRFPTKSMAFAACNTFDKMISELGG